MNKPISFGSRQAAAYLADHQNYNLGNVVRCLVDPSYRADIGREVEISQELAHQSGKKPTGIMVPFSELSRGLEVGTPAAGGHLVATDLLANDFIKALRPKSVVARLGATVISGLVGNVAIPRQVSGSTAYWVAENDSPTESGQEFDQVPMTPKTLGAWVAVSRKMLLQSSIDISAFVMEDLRIALAQEIDRVSLNGLGTGNTPLGILQNTDIATTSLGTNGGELSWADLVGLWSSVSAYNDGYGSIAFATTPNVQGKLMRTEKVANTGEFVWTTKPRPETAGDGLIGNAVAVASSLMPSNLTKGSGTSLSSMIAGHWSDLVIGQWGSGIELQVDPYTQATSGAVRLIAMTDVDIAIRHAESFRKVVDIITG